MSNDKSESKPMDPSARESATPQASINQPRPCWAAQTLVAEFTSLFPETAAEYSNYDRFNAALDVTLDLTSLAEGTDRDAALSLLSTLGGQVGTADSSVDPRIDYTIHSDHAVLVSMKPSARTKDSRDSFNLADAWSALTGADDVADGGDDFDTVFDGIGSW